MIDLLRSAFGKDTKFIVYDTHGEVPSRYYPDLVFRKLIYLARESYRNNLLIGPWWAKNLLRSLDNARFRFGLWGVKHNMRILSRACLSEIELRDLLEYQRADLIISSGGTYLVENYSLAHRIFDYELTLYLGRPLVFFTQSLGPFSNPSIRRSLAPVFDRSPLILVRDKQSWDNLIELGVKNGNVHLAADAAFAVSDTAALEAAKFPTNKSGQPLRVAISVREWRHFKTVEPASGMHQYQEAVRVLTQHLVQKHNAKITYLSTCQGMPEYWTDDSKVAQRIVDSLSDDIRGSVSVNTSFHQPAILAKMLKDYDLVIATRMHMAILAFTVGTPVLPIAYEFKMRELFEKLGQGRWVQDIETISADTLVEAADLYLDLMPQIRKALFSAVQKEHESAVASGSLVRDAFEQWQLLNNLNTAHLRETVPK